MTKQYFPTRNVGIVLLEIFAAEEKESMLDGLRRLFEWTELPTILRMEGVLSAGWDQNLGYLASSDSHYGDVVKKNLPPPFELIEVRVGQCFEFCYYLRFKCFIRPEFQSRVEASFIESRTRALEATIRSTERPNVGLFELFEPTIRDYQRQVESFLSMFVPGIFLSQKMDARLRCPSIRVLIADEIDFDKFESWFAAHSEFLRYLGLYGPCSRRDSYLISYQPDRLFKEQGVFAGLTFICSAVDYRAVTDTQDRETLDNVSFLFEIALLPFFVALYWAVNRLERTLAEWEQKVSALESRLRNTITNKRLLVFGSVKPVYGELIRLLNAFETFALNEERNISIMQRTLSHIKSPKSKPLPVFRIKTDVLSDIAEGTRFVEEEQDRLRFVRRKIATDFDQCKQYTDFALQSSMQTLTLVAVFLGVFALVSSLWTQLLSFFSWLASLLN